MSVAHDVKIALRAAAKHRVSTLLAIISIAIGIGTTTGVFTVADALLLRPLDIRQPDQLFEVTSVGEDGGRFFYGWADYEGMRVAASDRAELTALQRRGGMLARDEGGSDLVLVSPVAPNFFPMLGVRPILGALSFQSGDGRPGAILGWRLWQRRFNGDTGVIGKTITLSGHAFAVTAVMSRDFGGLERGISNDVWLSTDAWFDVLKRSERQSHSDQFEIIARLKPGTNSIELAERLDASIRGPDAHKPAPKGVRATAVTARFGGGWSDNVRLSGALLGVLVLVLFVACANVAQLRMAQTEARRKELAIRKALGAGTGRIARQLLTETAVLAIPGVLVGLLLAQYLLDFAAPFLPASSIALAIDRRVLVFTALASLFSLIVAGLSPVRMAAEISLSDAIKAGQGTAGSRPAWWRNLFMTAQIAISIALVGVALLFVFNLREVARIEPGFNPAKKLLIVNAVPGLSIAPHQWAEQVCDRLATLPGVRAATFARRLPLGSSGGGVTVSVEVGDQPPQAVRFNNVAGNYFDVMKPRLVRGRGIDANDLAGTPLVTVVSEKFARQFLPGRDPIGETIRVTPAFSSNPPKTWQVVGVVADAPINQLHETIEPYLYFSYAQMPVDDLTIALETATSPAASMRSMVETIRQFDPKATLYQMTTLEDYLSAAMTSDRLISAAATGLGLFSAALMAAGLFGALHYAVARRTRELGLRVALGATPARIRRLILGDALRLLWWGAPAGMLLSIGLGSLARALLVGVSAIDPWVCLGGATLVVGVVLLATWLPARSAARLEPMEALRAE